jgi:hypothetical protein
MDLIQRNAERQRLIERGMPAIWAGFRAALGELKTSYDAAPHQSGWTVEIEPVHDRSIVITQYRGRAPDAYNEVVLTITVVLDESGHAITASGVLLFTRFENSFVRGTFSYRYLIDAPMNQDSPGRVSLMLDDAPVSPLRAAEDLVGKTLFGTFAV